MTSSSDHNATRTSDRSDRIASRRVSTETKASLNMSELIVSVSILTIGYMVSRGLAKSGSRDFYDDSGDHEN